MLVVLGPRVAARAVDSQPVRMLSAGERKKIEKTEAETARRRPPRRENSQRPIYNPVKEAVSHSGTRVRRWAARPVASALKRKRVLTRLSRVPAKYLPQPG